MQTLIDERTGVIAASAAVDLPCGAFGWQAEVCETGAFGGRNGAQATAGSSWHSADRARRAAYGEALERYCGFLVPADRLRWGTWEELTAAGVDAADPVAFALYRESQRARPGFPFAGLSRSVRVAWVAGVTARGRTRWLPAALVWLSTGAQARDADRRLICLPVAAGIASGATYDQARTAALGEVVERHALASAWHAGTALVRLPDPRPGFSAFAVPNPFEAAVAVARLNRRPGCAVGAAFGSCWDKAVDRACAEAAMVARTLAMLDDAETGGLPAAQRPRGPLAEYRSDGRYRRDYAADWSDCTDILCHLQLMLDPDLAAASHAYLDAAEASGPEPWPAARLPALAERLAAGGLEPVTVDLTSPDVSCCGQWVVRVCVPGLRSTAPAAFPLLGDGAFPLPTEPRREPVPHA